MQNIVELLSTTTQNVNIENDISNIIFIASISQNTLEPLEMETLSKLCSVIYKKLYGNNFRRFKDILKTDIVKIELYTVRICNRSLWRAIWFNSIKNHEIFSSRNTETLIKNHSDFLLWCINFILNNIKVLDKNSLYSLRCLQFILNRKELLSRIHSDCILKVMNKVAISPHLGFKHLACNISKIIFPFLGNVSNEMFISGLPLCGIETYEIVNSLTGDFIKENMTTIIIKVLFMFSNNIENKDGGFIYEKVLICTFEEWINLVWPLFWNRLREIEHEGEFFQSLVKYWIPLTITAYRTDFCEFIERQPVDLRIKAHVLMESRKRGFIFEEENYICNYLQTLDFGLSITSIYKKKSLCPSIADIHFLMDYLYLNLKNYLEDEEIINIKKFVSQIAFVAHTDLNKKKSKNDFIFYAKFVNKIYIFCGKCLSTDFFEVGAQVLHLFLDILKGPHTELKLIYKLEKKDCYEQGENLLYIKLKERGLWKFEDFFPEIKKCVLRTDCCSLILTNLVSRHYSNFSFMNSDLFKNIIRKTEVIPNLLNTEKVINCSNLMFSRKDDTKTLVFIKEVESTLLNILCVENINESDLFKKVLYLEILTVAKKHQFNINNTNEIVKRSLMLIDCILETNILEGISYRYTKVVETFITRAIYLIAQNINELFPKLDISFAINTLIKIIEKSNMKRPVSVSAELLRQLGDKLEKDESGKIFKMRLLNETLKSLKKVLMRNNLKIRRNPESRLVIHAMCVSQRYSDKPHLHWTMNYILNMISNPETSDLSMSLCLHTIELLICDNRLQQQSMIYIPEIIVKCIELFKRTSWIVRNANLQLVKSLIERLYGVSMNHSCRPRNIADLLLLYPELAPYFFKILSLEKLDDRAVIIFQFFSESHVKKMILDENISEVIEYFKILLVHIIKNYENHYGKLAVRSYVSICCANDIPIIFLDIAEFIESCFANLPKNIFANLTFLMQELYEKYKGSYENQIDPSGLERMDSSWTNLTSFLRNFDGSLFDFLLIKIKPIADISNEKFYENNSWVYNNMTFFFLNATSSQICSVLEDEKFSDVPEFFQFKMLTILIQRFENDEFLDMDLENITNSLFFVALSLTDESYYLLNCYFKCLLIFQDNVKVKIKIKPLLSKNIYKNLITLIYCSKKTDQQNNDFFSEILDKLKSSISLNEDVDQDILSALTLSYHIFPKFLLGEIFKIVFYYSLLKSTYLEAFHFICNFMNRSYRGILDALNNFCAIEVLQKSLADDFYVRAFLNDVNNFINSDYFEKIRCEDEFYIVEDEIIVPKCFIKKILRCKKCFIKEIENKT